MKIRKVWMERERRLGRWCNWLVELERGEEWMIERDREIERER